MDMKDKFLIWIDDSADDMEPLLYGIIPKLWENNIVSKTVFLGDATRIPSDVTLKIYEQKIYNVFNNFLKSINENTTILSSDESNYIKELQEKYFSKYTHGDFAMQVSDDSTNEIAAWKNLNTDEKNAFIEKYKSDNDYKNKYTVESILNVIDNTLLPKKSADENKSYEVVYALDLVLLEKDEEKMNCISDQAIPIISMELYNYITKTLNKKCIIYTKYTFLNRVQNNWKNLYSKIYNDSEICRVEIKSREGLQFGSLNKHTIDCFKSMFEREDNYGN